MLRGRYLILMAVCCLSMVACNTGSQPITTISQASSNPASPTTIDLSGTPTHKESTGASASPTSFRETLSQTPSPNASRTPGLTATPTSLPCWGQGGRFEVDELVSEHLPDPLPYRVYLPPCYDKVPEQRYPVLYLIHGQSSNDDQWERLGVGVVVDELVLLGKLPPMIIVMPRDRVWREPTEDNFGRAVAEELVPWIDEYYRTWPERMYRAIGGLSRGGAWALHLGLEYWELFGSIGAHSGFIFQTDTYLVNGWLDEIPFENMPRIYMDVADRDRPSIVYSALWFEDLLTQRRIAHEWYVFIGFHEESYWEAHVEDYLKWYAWEWTKGGS